MTEHVLVKPSEPFDFSDWHWGDDVDDAFAELKDLMVTEITKVFTEAIPDCIMVWFRQEIRDTTTEPTLEVTFSVGQFDEKTVAVRYPLVAWLTDQTEDYVRFYGPGKDETDPRRIRLRALTDCLGSLHLRLKALIDEGEKHEHQAG